MTTTWSTELYYSDSINVCPACSNNIYRTRMLGPNLYKKCEECGRVSKVEGKDNLKEV